MGLSPHRTPRSQAPILPSAAARRAVSPIHDTQQQQEIPSQQRRGSATDQATYVSEAAAAAARHAQEQSRHRSRKDRQLTDAELRHELTSGPLTKERTAALIGARSVNMYSIGDMSAVYEFEPNSRFIHQPDPMTPRKVLIVQSRSSSATSNKANNAIDLQRRLQESLIVAIRLMHAARNVTYVRLIIIHFSHWSKYIILIIFEHKY